MTQESIVFPEHAHIPEPTDKSPDAFRTISEVAEHLDVPQHVLRFWESRFSQIKPLYRAGRRYYRPQDVDMIERIHRLLYKEGYTIKGARKALGQKDAPPAALPQHRKGLTDKQHSQLSVIRQELIGLRETLKPYITKS